MGEFDSLPAVSVFKGSVTCWPLYTPNHLEADTAIWYHVVQVNAAKLFFTRLIMTFTISVCILAEKYTDKYFLVCYKLFHETASFMDVTKLSKFLSDNTNLNRFKHFIGMVIMAVYACSGCDCVLFFRYHSKKSFLGTLVDKAEAFVGPSNENNIAREGLLSDIHNHGSSFPAFCRLIGCECEYLKVCLTSFIHDAIYIFQTLLLQWTWPASKSSAVAQLNRESHTQQWEKRGTLAPLQCCLGGALDEILLGMQGVAASRPGNHGYAQGGRPCLAAWCWATSHCPLQQ